MNAILHDVTRCRGCMKCVEACSTENFPDENAEVAEFLREDLSAHRYTTFSRTAEGRFYRHQCLHCIEASCEAACLVGALRRTPDGPVVYDADKCIGCRYCMLACPFQIPRYEWKSALPLIRKCQMCYDRAEGPACVNACPYEASEHGDRDKLLRVARKRFEEHPGKYIPHIWGEHEAGGTAVLYISDVSLDEFWPTTLGDRSIPGVNAPVVKTTPFVFVGVAGALSAFSWIVHRRNKLAEAASEGGDADVASQD